ncbi:MAG: prepilin-type N-terminal cleavage/methylation domain-containing protein [Planctomycetota bacterium]|nr:prepilin-type N-terminal cleavage/methylation domain-containing protein [Planctomycetota bacterium]
MKDKRGFTLIELMIVVAIIAIIAAIAIPSLLNARRSSNEKAALATCRNFNTAAVDYSENTPEQYYFENELSDFGDYFSHKDSKNGYRYFYRSNSATTAGADEALEDTADDDDATAFCYIAVPVSTNTGRKVYYVDETGQIYVCDLEANDLEITVFYDSATLQGTFDYDTTDEGDRWDAATEAQWESM